ncbi:MAG: methionyl-tRNA formyltransferase [Candidatus Hydrogenedentes bacterium]|nr:methionyl-tRNA formyltransferase [Candidatus Hydrogenedentota bacterium]
MRTVFFGTPELAVPCLAAIAAEHDVTAVVCQPDRPKGRGKTLVPPPVKVWAVEHGIPVHQPAKLNDGAFETWLRDQAPEICGIAAYGRLLKQPILDVPEQGWLNVHPSLLPRYRGPSPIQTAILNGDKTTGVTIMRLTLEMDAGDILLQEEVAIRDHDTSASLSERLAERGAALLAQGFGLVASGQAVFTPQDPDRVTYCRLFEKEDGRIRWAEPAAAIHNLVRAAIPWPVAHCALQGEVFRIHRTEPVESSAAAPPGTVVAVEADRMVVKAGEGAVAVLTIQAPGKRALPMADFLRGRPIEVGARFEDL